MVKLQAFVLISHTETPGLGDKIQTNKSDWILSFDGQTYQTEQDKIGM